MLLLTAQKVERIDRTWTYHAHPGEVKSALNFRMPPSRKIRLPLVGPSSQLGAPQLRAELDAASVVHPKHVDSRSSDCCDPFDARTP
jgi:hypothetical protein